MAIVDEITENRSDEKSKEAESLEGDDASEVLLSPSTSGITCEREHHLSESLPGGCDHRGCGLFFSCVEQGSIELSKAFI